MYSDDEHSSKRNQKDPAYATIVKSVRRETLKEYMRTFVFFVQTLARSASLSDAEKRLFGHAVDDEGNRKIRHSPSLTYSLILM